MNHQVDLSILIVNWNTRELLAGCLESVRGQGTGGRRQETGDRGKETGDRGQGAERLTDESFSLSIETFVVDNASTDGSAALVRERFPWVTLIENAENVGFARANNQAMAHAQGEYVLLLNSDTVVHPGALETLVAFMDAHPRAGACGPRLLNADGSLQPSAHPMLTPGRELWRLLFLDRLRPRATYRQETWDMTAPRPVEVLKGACLLLRRAALPPGPLFDERYFMYTEEVDLCYRLAQAGGEIWYLPRAVVTHFGEASSRQVHEAMYLQLYRSKVQFFRKFGGRRRAWQGKLFFLLAWLPRALLFTAGALVYAPWRSWARLYRRFLVALPGM